MDSSTPRFASFKAPPKKDSSKDKPDLGHQDRRRPARRRIHEHGHHRSSHPSDARFSNEDRALHSTRFTSPVSSDNHVAPRVDSQHIATMGWTIDIKGDVGILQYGGTERSKVPHYRLLTGRSTRNAPPVVDEGKYLSNLSRRDVKKLSRRVRYVSNNESLAHGQGNTTEEPRRVANFIPLPVLGKRKRRRNQAVGAETESEEQSSSTESVGSGSDANLPSGEKATSQEDSLRSRHASLQESAHSHPEDAGAWLELANFQEEWVDSGFGAQEQASTRTELRDRQQTTSKLRISTLESAMNKVPVKDKRFEDLLLALVSEYAVVLNSAQLENKWTKLLQGNPAAHHLRTRYLERAQCERGSAFKFQLCRQEYLTYLTELCRSSSESQDLNKLLHAFSKFTSFVYQSGFSEQAIALWQALLEIQVFRPAEVPTTYENSTNLQALSKAFEEFWEDEHARIGEPGATGWKHSVQRAASVVTQNQILAQSSEMSGISAWAAKEAVQSSVQCMSGKITDDDDEDPIHVVLFSDLEPYLELCAKPFTARMVVNAALSFCNCPLLSKAGDDVATATNGPHQIHFLPKPTNPVSDYSTLFQNLRTTANTLFCSDASPFCQFCTTGIAPALMHDFVYNVLELLALADADDLELVEYCIAFGAAFFPQRARKLAKRLLKAQPSQLRLYNCLALLELRNGRSEDAEKIASTAFDMGKKINGTHVEHERRLLKQTLVREALRQGRERAALSRLVSKNLTRALAKTDCLPTASELEIKERDLTTSVKKAIEHGDPEHIATSLDGLALLSYLGPFAHEHVSRPTRPALDLALAVFQDYLYDDGMVIPNITSEIVHQSCAQLIHHHVTTYHRAVTHAVLKDTLDFLRNAITRFPTNTAFQAVLNTVSPTTDPIRAILPSFGGDSREPSTLHAWATAITLEIQREAELGSTPYVVRRQFERAIASEDGKHCPALWAWWLRWEVDVANRDPAVVAAAGQSGKMAVEARRKAFKQAHDVWLRGHQGLPWVKSWLELGVQLLGDVFTDDAVKGFYDGMVDRGLRFRVDLHEVLAQSEKSD